FSSSRRHTSFSRDWSSDVCSSDLGAGNRTGPCLRSTRKERYPGMTPEQLLALYDKEQRIEVRYPDIRREVTPDVVRHVSLTGEEIGRASWRERVPGPPARR